VASATLALGVMLAAAPVCQPRASTPVPKGGTNMLDVLYIGLALGFFALSWGLVALCDRL
jgi:hypothetical protein